MREQAASSPGPVGEEGRLPPMTHYVLGLFRRPADRPPLSADEEGRVQEAHLGHLRRLRESGEVIAAGPIEEEADLRGIVLFATGSPERARDLTKDDPAIVRRRLVLDLYTWYGPVGLRVAPPIVDPTDLDFRSD